MRSVQYEQAYMFAYRCAAGEAAQRVLFNLYRSSFLFPEGLLIARLIVL